MSEPGELGRPFRYLRQHDLIWPSWVEMVLGPFAETKGHRLPGKNPAIQKNALTRKLGAQMPWVHLPTFSLIHPKMDFRHTS